MNTNAKHTPGPWRNIGRAIVTKDARIEIAVASTNDTKDAHVNENHRVMWEEAAANARLIAAAPDLLSALIQIESEAEFDADGDSLSRGEKLLEIAALARAALAKATEE